MPSHKLFLLSALVIILSHSSFAQIVWTVPAFPTKYDDVTVYYDATQGNAALEGFTGDVYAHTGVITSESTSGNDWRHVIGNWGTADARVLMTREGANLYSISYHISDFYNIPAGEEVLKMAFVFRNVMGSIVGRSTDGTDIFTDVYPSNTGLFITLHSPSAGDVVITENDSLLIDVLISDTVDLQIFNDGLQIYFDHTDRASFYYHPPSVGLHELEFVATSDTSVQLTKKYIVIEQDPEKINPPAGTVNGLNYFTDSTYIFQLYAPFKEYVFLLTSANGYSADTAFQLNQSEDGNTYWIELPRTLFTNDQNTYQYLVSESIRIADPHSEVVLDPNQDQFIDPLVMATLPPYPVGLTAGIVTAFDTTYQPFEFVVDSFIKIGKPKLVIYELLLRDFLAKHNFKTLEDTLDYFVKLGINAIELMPVNEFEGNLSWGYNPSFHMAVDKYYGIRQQLKSLIDAAHQRGIAVIFDVVFNHAFSQSPLAQMYWDAVNFRPAPGSPYMNVTPKHPFNVGYDINHESIATKIWVKRILSYWIEEFKVDGFRFDLSKGMTQFNSGNDAGLMARYDAGRIAILKDYADHIWSHDSTSYVILEHFADNNEEIVLSDYGMMLWGNLNYQFSQAAKGFQSDLEWVDYIFRGWDDPHLISYMESHDEERIMVRLLNEGDS
ncbi:MAG: alpha-amylase family glycosyl hydrolase, partial [Saprospiraceae bacterium]